MAPTSCATMRPVNEIQAERTLSFFSFFFPPLSAFAVCVSSIVE